MRRISLAAALAAVLLAAAPCRAAGKYHFEEDVDYTKALFSVRVSCSQKKNDMKAAATRNRLVADMTRQIQDSFLSRLEFIEGKEAGKGILKEAKEKKYGFCLMVSFKTLEGHIEQQMLIYSHGMWRGLYNVKMPPLPDTSLCKHPAEVPFLQAMLPLRVLEYSKKSVREKYEDGSSMMVKKYKVRYSVTNNLPFKVTGLSLCFLHKESNKTPGYYHAIVKDIEVAVEPGKSAEFTQEKTKFPHSIAFDNAKRATVYDVKLEDATAPAPSSAGEQEH